MRCNCTVYGVCCDSFAGASARIGAMRASSQWNPPRSATQDSRLDLAASLASDLLAGHTLMTQLSAEISEFLDRLESAPADETSLVACRAAASFGGLLARLEGRCQAAVLAIDETGCS